MFCVCVINGGVGVIVVLIFPLQTLKTYGNFTAWIVTADLILLGVLPDWANLQQGSLKGHKLLLPTVKPVSYRGLSM